MKKILCLIVILLLVICAVFAQNAARPGTSEARVAAHTTTGDRVDADRFEWVYTDVIITQDDIKITADKVVHTMDNNRVSVFVATGNPVFTDPENRITANAITAHSSPRFAEFTGNVKMVNTPDPNKPRDDSEFFDRSATTTITSDKLRYDYGERRAEFTGNVKAVQSDKTIFADKAVYDSASDMLYLTGNISMKNTGEGMIRSLVNAQSATISLVNDWFHIEARPGERVEMEFIFEDE